VECTFGVLSNKWIIFQRPLNVSPDFTVDVVKVCVILHSFVGERERDSYKLEDPVTVACLEDVSYGQSALGGLTANNVRNKVADYFLTDAGAVLIANVKIMNCRVHKTGKI
jgi:hypothetical protein